MKPVPFDIPRLTEDGLAVLVGDRLYGDEAAGPHLDKLKKMSVTREPEAECGNLAASAGRGRLCKRRRVVQPEGTALPLLPHGFGTSGGRPPTDDERQFHHRSHDHHDRGKERDDLQRTTGPYRCERQLGRSRCLSPTSARTDCASDEQHSG